MAKADQIPEGEGTRPAEEETKDSKPFWNKALIVVAVAALLSGMGYLIAQFIESDRTDLSLSLDNPQQILPIKDALPRFREKTVFCEAMRMNVVLSHNQEGAKPIRVKRLRIESQPVQLSDEEESGLTYDIDVLRLPPHGILKLREYVFAVNSAGVTAKYLKTRESDGAVPVASSNIFASVQQTEAVTLSPSGDDAHFQFTAAIETEAPGLYKLRFCAAYDVGGSQKEAKTDWVYVYMR